MKNRDLLDICVKNKYIFQSDGCNVKKNDIFFIGKNKFIQ